MVNPSSIKHLMTSPKSIVGRNNEHLPASSLCSVEIGRKYAIFLFKFQVKNL
jgi:hypothetical protein